MAADKVTELTLETDQAVSPVKQDLEDLEHRLGTQSENINLCNQVLNDLRDLIGVLERKSLQDVTLPPQK